VGLQLSKFDLTIPLSDDLKTKIIQAIYDGYKNDILDFKREYPLETYNCIPFMKWDFINTNIINRVNDEKFQCFKISRGRWKLILLYDKDTKYLYVMMNKNRFEQLQDELQNRINNNKVHYIDALALINKDLNELSKNSNIQLSFFDDYELREKEIEVLLHNEILKNIDNEVNRLVVISFSVNRLEITSVIAYILTTELEIVYEENWNEFISIDYDNISDNELFDINEDDDDIEIGIRDIVFMNNSDELVKIKDISKDKKEVGK
jgi:hypothetical protein